MNKHLAIKADAIAYRQFTESQSLRKAAKILGYSYENVRRRCDRHLLYKKYQDIFDAFSFRLVMIIVNYLNSRYTEGEKLRRTTLQKIFKMDDRELREIPGIGEGYVKEIRRIQNEHRN